MKKLATALTFVIALALGGALQSTVVQAACVLSGLNDTVIDGTVIDIVHKDNFDGLTHIISVRSFALANYFWFGTTQDDSIVNAAWVAKTSQVRVFMQTDSSTCPLLPTPGNTNVTALSQGQIKSLCTSLLFAGCR